MPHIWKIALPFDVAERVKAEAAALGVPQNRVIINDLAAVPGLKQQQQKNEVIQHALTMLERYGMRITAIDLNEKLLDAVKAFAEASGPVALESAGERVRIAYREMLAHEVRRETAATAQSRELPAKQVSRKAKVEA
jgi:hypothetical protein